MDPGGLHKLKMTSLLFDGNKDQSLYLASIWLLDAANIICNMSTHHSFHVNQKYDILIGSCLQENTRPQKSLEMLEKSDNPHTVYDTERDPGQTDVTVHTTPNHDPNQVKIKY